MAARTPPRTPGAQGGGQGAAPLGRSRSLCPCASFVFPEPEVMLKTSLECPFEPLNGMGGGFFFNVISYFTREKPEADLHSGSTRLAPHAFFSPEHPFAPRSFIPGQAFQNRREHMQKAQWDETRVLFGLGLGRKS